jgi:hypothetical protein
MNSNVFGYLVQQRPGSVYQVKLRFKPFPIKVPQQMHNLPLGTSTVHRADRKHHSQPLHL